MHLPKQPAPNPRESAPPQWAAPKILNAIALASASVTRIRDARADAAKRAADTTARVTRTANDSQLPACMRAEAKARGNTDAECIE